LTTPVRRAEQDREDAASRHVADTDPAPRHAWLEGVDTSHRQARDDLLLSQQALARCLSELRLVSNTIGITLENDRRMRAGRHWLVLDPAHSRAAALVGASLRQAHDELADRLQEMETSVSRGFVQMRALCEELERVRLLSLTDEFTGLPNRRAFYQKLEDELSRARRYGSPIALAMIDLDQFKTVNDVYGHSAGDTVLGCYANCVLSEVRHHDVVARYGGEEFAIMFPSTAREGAVRALEKLRRLAARTRCKLADGRSIEVPSFSAGVTVTDGDDGIDTLLGRADRALYRAKGRGRNRIEIELRDGDRQSGVV
jgi:diguanylate cyclase (GGDEF)-like protein